MLGLVLTALGGAVAALVVYLVYDLILHPYLTWRRFRAQGIPGFPFGESSHMPAARLSVFRHARGPAAVCGYSTPPDPLRQCAPCCSVPVCRGRSFRL